VRPPSVAPWRVLVEMCALACHAFAGAPPLPLRAWTYPVPVNDLHAPASARSLGPGARASAAPPPDVSREKREGEKGERPSARRWRSGLLGLLEVLRVQAVLWLDRLLDQKMGAAAYNARNRYLVGAWEPVLEEHHAEEARVVAGALPADLRGVFLRIGPNPPVTPTKRHHVFDGEGMIHRQGIMERETDRQSTHITHTYTRTHTHTHTHTHTIHTQTHTQTHTQSTHKHTHNPHTNTHTIHTHTQSTACGSTRARSYTPIRS